MRNWLVVAVAAAGVVSAAGPAHAQRTNKVIDTDALVVKPVDTTTTVVGRSFQYVSRAVANTVDNSALIRTVNNLFGTNQPGSPKQVGLSPLPAPSAYPSTYYKSPLQPVMPKYQTINR